MLEELKELQDYEDSLKVKKNKKHIR